MSDSDSSPGIMNVLKPLILLVSYSLAIVAAIDSELDKDVEIIAGSDGSQPSPLDAKFVGQSFPNDVYAPQVRAIQLD